MKKIIYLARFFSGLHYSFLNKEWKPDGVPTVYKMIEGLDKSKHKVEFVFSNYNLNSSSRFIKFYTKLKLVNFRSDFHILSVNSKNNFLRRLLNFFFILKKFYFIFCLIKKFKPDLVYIDRAHVIEGAIIKKFLKTKVLLRVMGVAVYSYNSIVSGNSLFSKISRWAFKINFDHILFSQDGGDIESFKKKYISKRTNTSTFLNGVKKSRIIKNEFSNLKNKSRNKIRILFVSRLEKNKNCDLFLRSITKLDEHIKKKIFVLIVGTGPEVYNLKKFVKDKKAMSIINFLGSINHNKINQIYDIADIFVSLNTTGNFANNCLEAFYSGTCCIIPSENNNNGCDKIISDYIKKESIIRLSRLNPEQDLTNILSNLVINRKKILLYAKNIKEDSRRFLTSWDIRVKKELLLIDKIIDK